MRHALRHRYGRAVHAATRALVMVIYKRMPIGNKHLRGGKHHIMFSGNSARTYGVENYTTVALEDLTVEELERAARAVGVKT